MEIANGDHLSYVCTAGSLSQYAGVRLQIYSSLSGQAVKSGEVMICTDSATDGRVDYLRPAVRPSVAGRRLAAMAAACTEPMPLV